MTIKPAKKQTMTAVRGNETFCRLTAVATAIETYSVNDEYCLGVSFDKGNAATIRQLEEFCERALLEACAMPIPWANSRTLVLIRPYGNWKPSCLPK